MGPAAYSKIVRALSFLRSQKHGATIGTLMEHLECSRSTVERILQELKNSGFDLVDAHHAGDDHRIKRWSLAREGLLSNPAAEQLLSLTIDERLALEQTFRSASDPALKDGLSKVLALKLHFLALGKSTLMSWWREIYARRAWGRSKGLTLTPLKPCAPP